VDNAIHVAILASMAVYIPYIGGPLLALGLFMLVAWITALNQNRYVETRKYDFQKISDEYGLKLKCQKCTISAVIKGKQYPLLSITGSVRSHTILLEDIFVELMGISSVHWTELTVDGIKRVLNDDDKRGRFLRVPSTLPATPEQIRAALDDLV